jgi:Fe-S-cluster containining protein
MGNPGDEPIRRVDFERAMRHLNLADLELRDAVLQLGARVVALTDELTRRLDGVEPEPAPPGTAAAASARTVETAVAHDAPATYEQVLTADARGQWRVCLDLGPSKYEVEPSTPPCDELLPLCAARCCTFHFDLSTVDLDEGVIRWDYGQPYLLRQGRDGYCVHSDPASRACTVHAQRPRACRTYDCRGDTRIWIDYERRIPAPHVPAARTAPHAPPDEFQLLERVRARAAAISAEHHAVYRVVKSDA